MTSPLRAALRERLKVAMRARDRQTAEAMRSVLSALDNAEAVPVTPPGSVAMSEYVAGAPVGLGASEGPRRVLSSDEERALVAREVAELRSSAATLAGAGRYDRSSELVAMAAIVEAVLDGWSGGQAAGDDRNAGDNPSLGRDAGAPGEASER